MYVTDLANEIWLELSQPSDITIPSISTWLRFGSNLGQLNNYIGQSFSISSPSLEIVDSSNNQIGLVESSIYAQLYYYYYYGKRANDFLYASSIDVLIEAQSDGGNLRFLDRTKLAQIYLQLKKEAKILLDKLINAYNFRGARALQVIGDDIYVNFPQSRLVMGRNQILT